MRIALPETESQPSMTLERLYELKDCIILRYIAEEAGWDKTAMAEYQRRNVDMSSTRISTLIPLMARWWKLRNQIVNSTNSSNRYGRRSRN